MRNFYGTIYKGYVYVRRLLLSVFSSWSLYAYTCTLISNSNTSMVSFEQADSTACTRCGYGGLNKPTMYTYVVSNLGLQCSLSIYKNVVKPTP